MVNCNPMADNPYTSAYLLGNAVSILESFQPSYGKCGFKRLAIFNVVARIRSVPVSQVMSFREFAEALHSLTYHEIDHRGK